MLQDCRDCYEEMLTTESGRVVSCQLTLVAQNLSCRNISWHVVSRRVGEVKVFFS